MAQFSASGGDGGTPTVVLGDPPVLFPSPSQSGPSSVTRFGPVRAELDLLVGDRLDTSGGEQSRSCTRTRTAPRTTRPRRTRWAGCRAI
ncbi:hypothetical protein [Micromonospora sp. b486]|uniref:hypothetical protein n=1 Tax=Micromonospora sp. b486 TaxID=3053986 RepID=UPI00259D2ED8|nr:hypothetical protein [Micromonospora sp. b486]MDM4784471.1 hypothetical protein [Micromonospora sp. b486]